MKKRVRIFDKKTRECLNGIFLSSNLVFIWFKEIMKGYSERTVNPLYKTSNMEYGGKRPNVHTMPTVYFSKTAGFTEVINTHS